MRRLSQRRRPAVELAETVGQGLSIGLLISGWVVFPVSFLAGMLAFRAREGAYRYKQPAEA